MCCTISSKYETCLIPSDWIEPMAWTMVNYHQLLQTVNQGKRLYSGLCRRDYVPVMCVAVVRSAALH